MALVVAVLDGLTLSSLASGHPGDGDAAVGLLLHLLGDALRTEPPVAGGAERS